MSRTRRTLIHSLVPLTLVLAVATAEANNALPAGPRATPIDILSTGAEDALATIAGGVVFRNQLASSTRIIFASKDDSAFDCVTDGDDAVRSRTSQYLIRGGAELVCSVRPGRYRYTTLTSDGGGVHKAKSVLRVKN